MMNQKIETLRTLAHPVRIQILRELADGVKCVSDIEEFLDISQPNLSQHLSLMRRIGVIDYFMDGRLRCYFLVDAMAADLLDLLDADHSVPLDAPTCCPVTGKGRRASN